MRAMILAAGRGERLRPLTDHTPKPLLPIGDHLLIEYHILHLKLAGIEEIVINVSYQADLIMQTLGDGKKYGLHISYSIEPEVGGLETGGGIKQALPLLGEDYFIVVNADIWTTYPFSHLIRRKMTDLLHLVLISNPEHVPNGDFALNQSRLLKEGKPRYTFSGIAVYHPNLFKTCELKKFSVVRLIHQAIEAQQASGEFYPGDWYDVGTEARLLQLRAKIPTQSRLA